MAMVGWGEMALSRHFPSGGGRDRKATTGAQSPTKEPLLDLAQDSFPPPLPGQAKYQLIRTRTRHQAHTHARFTLQKSYTRRQRDIPAPWGHFNTGQRVLKRDQNSTLSPFLILSVLSYVHV